MKIENSSAYQYHSNTSKLTFGAIHPTRYFIKNIDGTFTQITDNPEAIKDMQRTIVGLLNKFANDHKLRLTGKTPKAESATAKAL